MSQTDAILSDLRAGRSLTPREALNLYGTMRLAARIDDAKKLLDPDEEIVTERVSLPSRKVVARYRLVPRYRVLESGDIVYHEYPVRNGRVVFADGHIVELPSGVRVLRVPQRPAQVALPW